MSIKSLQILSKKIRKNILFAAYNAGASSSHLGGALSLADIFAVLYGTIIKIDFKKELDFNRDRVILSKGHGCLVLYSSLVEKGFIKKKELEIFEKNGSYLLGHPVINKKKGIEFSTGSLGMGLSLGIGVSVAALKRNLKYHTYVVIGDGECNEGSVWEAALLGGHLGLKNLTVIIDKNGFQQTGKNKDILNLGNLSLKWKSFGWEPITINGHDHKEILKAIKKKVKNPKVIIAKTKKGKGISFAENNNDWHHNILTKNNYEIGVKEIENENKI